MNITETSTWLEIDLEAIRHNVRELGRISASPLMAVVKANGYGHGIVEVGRAAVEAGAAWLGVARIEEALSLRAAGLDGPILVLGYTAPDRAAEAIAHRLTLAVYDPELAEALSNQAVQAGGKIQVHAKFDSGMGRLGVFPEEGLAFIRKLRELPGFDLQGMFTHFARSDEAQRATTDWQFRRFDTLVEQCTQAGIRPAIVHAANSAAALYYPAARYDLVRCGIAIYGLHPSDETPLPGTFRTALSWKARLTSVKDLPAGTGIGYGHRYTTSAPERIGVVSVGYADGFRRRLGNFALVGGKRVKLTGGVCMDQVMLQLDEVPEAKVGDEVVLIGRQGNECITAEEIGREWNTVNYDVVCGLQARVPRFYFNR